MKVQPKGTNKVVKRGRQRRSEPRIEEAIRLLRRVDQEVVIPYIRVTKNDRATKAKYRARITTVANLLGKKVSVHWTDEAKARPVISKVNR